MNLIKMNTQNCQNFMNQKKIKKKGECENERKC